MQTQNTARVLIAMVNLVILLAASILLQSSNAHAQISTEAADTRELVARVELTEPDVPELGSDRYRPDTYFDRLQRRAVVEEAGEADDGCGVGSGKGFAGKDQEGIPRPDRPSRHERDIECPGRIGT